MGTIDSTSSGGNLTLSRGPTAKQGFAAVTVTTLLDAATTIVGLTFVPTLVEGNPVVRAVFRETGVVLGVALVTAVVVVAVTLLTEFAVVLTYRYPNPQPSKNAVRYVGYGVPSVISILAAIHNATLLLTGAPLL